MIGLGRYHWSASFVIDLSTHEAQSRLDFRSLEEKCPDARRTRRALGWLRPRAANPRKGLGTRGPTCTLHLLPRRRRSAGVVRALHVVHGFRWGLFIASARLTA
jgi:hypothetical protein